jgi:hypothetical protein
MTKQPAVIILSNCSFGEQGDPLLLDCDAPLNRFRCECEGNRNIRSILPSLRNYLIYPLSINAKPASPAP